MQRKKRNKVRSISEAIIFSSFKIFGNEKHPQVDVNNPIFEFVRQFPSQVNNENDYRHTDGDWAFSKYCFETLFQQLEQRYSWSASHESVNFYFFKNSTFGSKTVMSLFIFLQRILLKILALNIDPLKGFSFKGSFFL